MHYFKRILYQGWIYYKDIFTYPKKVLEISQSQNHDAYWEKKRGNRIGLLSSWQKERADLIMRHIDKNIKVSIGDIACGEGSIIKYIKENRNISKAYGYDSSKVALDTAKKLGADEVFQIDINNAEDLEKVKEVDYALMLEILEHVSESEKILESIYTKTRKGIFFSFPNSGFLTYRLRLLFGKFPKQWINFPNEHLRFWTTQDLRYWLKALGYKKYIIHHYKGIPILNKVYPSLFATSMLVFIEK